MRKSDIKQSLVDLYAKLGKAPGWKAVENEGVDEDDIFAHWDSLADALDDVIGPKWRRSVASTVAEDLEDEEEEAPRGEQYSVYVVRLRAKVMEVGRFAKKNPRGELGCIYVGQTWHTPAVRLQNHLRGHKACPLVKKYGQDLVKKLTKEGQFATRAEAVAEEKRYARELRRQGYRVWSN